MTNHHLAAGFSNSPYWQEGTGQILSGLTGLPSELPARAEVLIIGAGFTGLSAALELARAGREVIVVDAEGPGAGCSGRNGGMIGPSYHKLGLEGLEASHGKAKMHDLLAESRECLGFLLEFLSGEKIDCDLRLSGRFRGADRPRHYDDLARELEGLKLVVDLDADMVPRAEQHAEIGSDAYYGGAVYHGDGHLHPGRYVAGLAERAQAAGVRIIGQAAVSGVRRDAGDFTLEIGSHRLLAKQVLVATNGYTSRSLGWFRRRVLPIRSAIIATEPVDKALIRQLSPRDRCFSGTSRLMNYYRPSPDGTRMIFGGRALHLADRPAAYSLDLNRQMHRIFPQLDGVNLSHGWSGTVAYTFDHIPHIGQHDGLYYAMGYCGSGVGRSTYYGRKVALKMMGDPRGATTIDGLSFKSRPFYTGTPWFLPAVLRWHAFVDRYSGS